jgi:hypothetical protein
MQLTTLLSWAGIADFQKKTSENGSFSSIPILNSYGWGIKGKQEKIRNKSAQ